MVKRPFDWRVGAAITTALAIFALANIVPSESPAARAPAISKAVLSPLLSGSLQEGRFPETLTLPDFSSQGPVDVEYTIDWDLQQAVEKTLNSYRPDYGALVAMEAETGRVVAMASYSRVKNTIGNLTLRGTFPAASLFKIVTAAAALDQSKAGPDTVISYNGGNHTLYRRNVNQTQFNRWTNHMSLKEAFAKSVNVVFAKLGVFMLSNEELGRYAERFQFNQAIHSDIAIEPGRFEMSDNTDWSRAEIASGFNRSVTLSPLQAAMLAGAVANDGVLMEPYIVDKLIPKNDAELYVGKPHAASVTMGSEACRSLRQMMQATIKNGTSRGAFRTFLRSRHFDDLELGGKTGSLTGREPRGKYDWFVGYAMGRRQRLAIAALTINEEQWRVKSSHLARVFLEKYFSPKRLPKLIANGPH